MKKKILRGIALMLSMVFLTGCSQKEEEAPPELLTLAEYSVPVTIDGIEIVVGTTTLQPLLDAGLSIMVSEWTGDQVLEREIDPEEILAAGTSETDISFWITDSAFARLSLEAADTDVRMGDAPSDGHAAGQYIHQWRSCHRAVACQSRRDVPGL